MTATQIPSFRLTLAAMFLTSLGTLSAQTTIDFGSDDFIETSTGWVANTDPSGFSATEQAWILQMVNAKLQAAGINHTAAAGNSGPCRIIISDSQAPPIGSLQGAETDVGSGNGGPAIVFMAEHPAGPNYQHVNDIANSIKALIAAKLAAGANYNAGSNTNAMTQLQGSARFTDLGYGTTAATQMQLNAGVMNGMTERYPRPTDVRYQLDTTPGRRLNSFDVQLTYVAGQHPGSSFGHLRADGTFVTFGQQGTLQSAPASFFFDGSGVDFAIRLSNGAVYSLSNGAGRARLMQANANNLDVFDRIDVDFDTDGNRIADALIQVQATGNGTGGFYTRFYPGTDEDLELTGSVNIHAAWLGGNFAQVAHAGSVFYPRMRSPENQFTGAPAFLIGEPFVTTAPTPVGLPGIHLSAGGHFLLMVGTMGPAGFLGSMPIPAGWTGYHLLMQGVSLSPNAGNGVFGATDAVTLTFL